MKFKSAFAAILAVSFPVLTAVELNAGVILISTRKNICKDQGADDFDEKGPGMTTPGDVAMGTLLGDHGYSSRLILDVLLGSDPTGYFNPATGDLGIDLVIWSGSSSSADVPAPPGGIPLMMGEHVTLGNNPDRAGSIYMYNGTRSTDPNDGTGASKFMKVVDANHPIMAGIPVDDQGRVKIFRDAYPEEESHVPPNGKKNFEYRWCTQIVADKAPGTTVLGILDGAEERSCLAVVDKGGMLANQQAASARMVHMFMNENGSGGSRRVFLALTDLGKVIFVRAAKWAMGEQLTPYQTLRIKEVKQLAGQNISLSWDGSTNRNYRVQASLDFKGWHNVTEDILGKEGSVSSTLDLSQSPQTVFLRVGSIP